MRSYQVVEFGHTLRDTDMLDPKPTGDEVVIAVKAAGVCHSDLHIWEGGFDLGGGRKLTLKDRGVQLPLTLGHETAGEILSIGPNVTDRKVGEMCLVYPWIGCGVCRVARTPEPKPPARDHHGHLIEMPLRRWPRASTAKFSGEQRPELQDPPSHRFVGDIQTALSEQIFDVAIAERKTHIEPNGVPDDRGRKLMGANEIVMRHLTRQANVRYRSRDKAPRATTPCPAPRLQPMLNQLPPAYPSPTPGA